MITDQLANLPFQYWVLAVAISLLMAGCLVLIAILYIRRLVSATRKKKRHDLQFRYQYFLYDALVESEAGKTPEAFQEFVVNLFREEEEKHGLNKELLINIILDLKKSLSGQSRAQLLEIAATLKLPDYALRKLDRLSFNTQIQALREISGLQVTDSAVQEKVKQIQYAKHAALSQEASLTLIKLGESPDLSFLDVLTTPLSQWQQIHLHHCLRNFERHQLPDFSQWLTSTNESVVLFSLRMITEFEQCNNSELIIHQLSHKSANVVTEAIYTVSQLKIASAVPTLVSLLHQPNPRIQISSIRAIGRLGTTQQVPDLESLRIDSSYWVRQITVEAIARLRTKVDSASEVIHQS
ncbi:MAG: HEAT repeat domain-containing protein [Cyclobacteriaceae bacterium]